MIELLDLLREIRDLRRLRQLLESQLERSNGPRLIRKVLRATARL
jgi:hypothetical protein